MKRYKILVIGGAGYIGSHMVMNLLKAGYHVITMDNLSTGHHELLQGGRFIKGDLSDASLLDTIFANNTIDIVMHFAAHSQVGESVKKPLKYYSNNISATVELLKSMLRHNIKRFIFSSSAAVYGEPANAEPITEKHSCKPTNPYGVTKQAVERILSDCDSAYGFKYISLRYFNAAGADESGKIGEMHQPETHLIPLILKVAGGELTDIKIFGNDYLTPDGTCIRDYIHVNDLVEAHMLAMESLLAEGKSAIYNVGNSYGYSVREVIETAIKVTGQQVLALETDRRPGDPPVLVANSNKIRRELGWKPHYEDLNTIIKTAWHWHQKCFEIKI